MKRTYSNVWDGMSETRVKLEKSPEFSELSVELYTGLYYTQEELDAAIAAGTAQNVTEETFGTGAGYLGNYAEGNGCAFTARWLRDGTAVALRPLYVWMDISGDSWSYSGLKDESGRSVYTSSSSYHDSTQGFNVREYVAREDVAVDGSYFLSMSYYHNGTQVGDATAYVSAYVGNYRTLKEAAGQTDIAAQLFGTTGYQANYSGGVIFSILCPRSSLRRRHERCSHSIQTHGHVEYRYRPLYQWFESSLGDKAIVEPFGRSAENQTLVDRGHANLGRCRIGRNRLDDPRPPGFPVLPGLHVVAGIQFGHPRYCCRRILYVRVK